MNEYTHIALQFLFVTLNTLQKKKNVTVFLKKKKNIYNKKQNKTKTIRKNKKQKTKKNENKQDLHLRSLSAAI